MPVTPVSFSARLTKRDLKELDELARLLRLKRTPTLRLVVTDRLEALRSQGVQPQETEAVLP